MFRSIITGTFPFFHRMTRKYCLILAISLWWDGSVIVVRKCDKPADRLTIRQLGNTSNLLGRRLRSLTLLRWRGGEGRMVYSPSTQNNDHRCGAAMTGKDSFPDLSTDSRLHHPTLPPPKVYIINVSPWI